MKKSLINKLERLKYLLILLAILPAGCASRGEVRARADYTETQGPRAAVELAAKW